MSQHKNRPAQPVDEFIQPRAQVFIARLLNVRVKNGWKSPHFWIIAVFLALIGFIYYRVLTNYRDIYIILFFYPMMYSALTFRLRGAIISGLIFVAIILPQTIWLTHDSYSTVRTLLIAIVAFISSSTGATLLNYLEKQLASNREIIHLNEQLNIYITQLERAQKQLIQAEKMNALGQLSASVAHEINNPLAGILVYSKLMSKQIKDGTVDKEELIVNLAKIDTAVNYCSKIVRGLLDFARQTEPILKAIQIKDVLDQVMTLVGHQAKSKNINVIRNEAPTVPAVMADFGQIEQVFVNLVVNAIQATANGGTLSINTSATQDGSVRVSFAHTGVGITHENIDRLFTPFFTTKTETKGVGLGLSVSYGIVQRHGGRIDVESQVGKGSTFTVILPAVK